MWMGGRWGRERDERSLGECVYAELWRVAEGEDLLCGSVGFFDPVVVGDVRVVEHACYEELIGRWWC